MPQVLDTFLITRRSNYPERMEIDCTFHDVGRLCFFSAPVNGITLE
jgi:hypothetical protein